VVSRPMSTYRRCGSHLGANSSGYRIKRNLTESVVTYRNDINQQQKGTSSIDDALMEELQHHQLGLYLTPDASEPPKELVDEPVVDVSGDESDIEEIHSRAWRKNRTENIINLDGSDNFDEAFQPCLIDQVCCRLIGSYLNDGVDVTRKFSFRIGSNKFSFEPCTERVECTKNMKMRCYELIDAESFEDLWSDNFSDTVDLLKNSVIITFNWFNPTGILDYISLGKRLLDPRLVQLSSTKYPSVQIGDIYKELAEIFYETNAFKRLLRRMKKQGKHVIISGFSLGGAISLGISSFVHEFYSGRKNNSFVDPSKKVRVVTFGAPRTGNDAFVHYCNEILHPLSACYVMSSNGGNTTDMILKDSDDLVTDKKKSSWSLMSHCVQQTSNALDSRNLLNEPTFNSLSIICRGVEDGNRSSSGFISKIGCNDACDAAGKDRNSGVGKAIRRQESLMYDPVCISQVSKECHDDNLLLNGGRSSYAIANPNTMLMIKELGLYRSLNNADLLYWKWLESSGEYMVDQGLAKTMMNFISRRSPFAAKFDEAFNELHSISVYYATMLGITDGDTNSVGTAFM